MNYMTFDQQAISFERQDRAITTHYMGNSARTMVLPEGESCLVSGAFGNDLMSLHTLEYIFNIFPQVKKLQIEGSAFRVIFREEFFQTANLWHKRESLELGPELWNRRAERPHPLRSDKKDGVFYQRYLPLLNKTISFRGIDADKDLDTFYEWHNQPRVNFFWELAKEKGELLEYMNKTKADPHMKPVFVEMDGSPVGYFEMYWTLEDRLGPYYEADAYDRGFHFLIGEKSALGYDNTNSIIRSAIHFLFLDDPRTRRVMAEPRHDNKKVLKYAETSGWKKLKEFDFPHKRAALLECKRENFFNGDHL